jgi:hypothetical protein
MSEFAIARSGIWRLPLKLIGATDARSKATLEDDVVDVTFGIARVRIPYTNIRSVTPRRWSWWLGVGIRIAGDKTLGLVGATTGVVQIALNEPTVEGVRFMRRPRNIAVSLEDPEGFIHAVEGRLDRAGP